MPPPAHSPRRITRHGAPTLPPPPSPPTPATGQRQQITEHPDYWQAGKEASELAVVVHDDKSSADPDLSAGATDDDGKNATENQAAVTRDESSPRVSMRTAFASKINIYPLALAFCAR